MDPKILSKVGYDSELPHHYIFGVRVHDMKSKDAGQLYLKYGPIYFNNKDIEKVRNIVYRISDKVFEQTESEALNIEGCQDLVCSILYMQVSCRANDCTMHHVSTSFELKDEDVVTFINSCNYSKESKQKLMEAII